MPAAESVELSDALVEVAQHQRVLLLAVVGRLQTRHRPRVEVVGVNSANRRRPL